MRRAQPGETGRVAEERALAHLRGAGLRLVERNYRCRLGEVDLIMTDGRTVVFVEVRYRRHGGFGGAVGSIDGRKQRRLTAAAAHFLQRRGWGRHPCRFDVVALDGDRDHGTLHWISDAFAAAP